MREKSEMPDKERVLRAYLVILRVGRRNVRLERAFLCAPSDHNLARHHRFELFLEAEEVIVI